MNLKERFLFLLFLFGSLAFIKGQPPLDLDVKYDTYRERFLNDFIKIDWSGDGIGEFNAERGHYEKAGYSIPASYYFDLPNAQALWEYHSDNCRDNDKVEQKPGVIKWADGTLHLGFYWTLLATEYAWFELNNQPEKAKRTALELYLALQAYKRLDLQGQRIADKWNEENKPKCEYNPLYTGYTGFFVRDDVPRDFKEHWGHGGVISSLACREKATDFFEEAGERNVVSHDQIAWLLMGLSCIKHAFPNDSFHVDEHHFHVLAEARKIAYGMVSYVHSRPFRSIRFPACKNKKVQTGGDSFVYALGMKRALDYIAPGHRIKSSLLDLIGWELVAEDLGVVLARSLGLANNDNIAMYLSYCVSADMESWKDVFRMSMKASQKQIYPMIKLWLHNYDRSRLPEAYWLELMKILEEAPIQGTGLDVVTEDQDWRFDNRWRTHAENKGKHAYGNGLDFMVAYNLYRIMEKTKNKDE